MMPKGVMRFSDDIMLKKEAMSFSELIPTDVSTSAAIAICAIAFVAGTARGFSGFGAAACGLRLDSIFAAATR